MDALLLIFILIIIAWGSRMAATKPQPSKTTPVAVQMLTPSQSNYQQITPYTGPSGTYKVSYILLGLFLFFMVCITFAHFQDTVIPHNALRLNGAIATVRVLEGWEEEIRLETGAGEGPTSYTTGTLYYMAYILPGAASYPFQIIPPCFADVWQSAQIGSDGVKIIRSGFDVYLDWQKQQALSPLPTPPDSIESNGSHPRQISRPPCVNITKIDPHTYEAIKPDSKIDIIYDKNDLRNVKPLTNYQEQLRNGLGTERFFWTIGFATACLPVVWWLEVRAQRKYDKFWDESVVTKGKITYLYQDPEDGSIMHVGYTYLGKFQAHQRVTQLHKPLSVGDEITVLYLAERPEIAKGEL